MKLTPPKYGLILGTKLKMKYDALGNRVVKEVPKRKQKEIYVRDAQGNILALYEVRNDSLYTKEFYIYGSQRLGYLEDDVFMGRRCIGKWCNVLTPVLPMLPSTLSNSVSIVFGKKRYELSDWLGNVRVVVNDRKTPVNIGTTTVGYKAQVVSVSDYYSFGSEIAERTYEVVKPLYRFGFQAQEKDNEIYGKGNTLSFRFRIYNSRIGRFLSVDPLMKNYVYYSPYQFAGNRPIDCIDVEGKEPKSVVKPYSQEKTIIFHDDLPSQTQITKVTVTTYKFTDAAAHLLSLVSGIPEEEIKKINVSKGILLYDPMKGGGAMTLPNDDGYKMIMTINFFEGEGKFGNYDYGNSVIDWLEQASHEVGHLRDIKEIGKSKLIYGTTFLIGYFKNALKDIRSLGHDAYWREKRAEKGRIEFGKFKDYVESNYGKNKLKELFEKNTDDEINKNLDEWWGKYQESKQDKHKSDKKN